MKGQRIIAIFALLVVSGFAQAVPETPKKKPTPISNEERLALVQAADAAKGTQVKLELARFERAQALVPIEAAAKAAQLRLQAAQLAAEASTLKLQSDLTAANEKVQAVLNDLKKKHDAVGCDAAGNDWKCPDPPKPEVAPPMCGDKPCTGAK